MPRKPGKKREAPPDGIDELRALIDRDRLEFEESGLPLVVERDAAGRVVRVRLPPQNLHELWTSFRSQLRYARQEARRNRRLRKKRGGAGPSRLSERAFGRRVTRLMDDLSALPGMNKGACRAWLTWWRLSTPAELIPIANQIMNRVDNERLPPVWSQHQVPWIVLTYLSPWTRLLDVPGVAEALDLLARLRYEAERGEPRGTHSLGIGYLAAMVKTLCGEPNWEILDAVRCVSWLARKGGGWDVPRSSAEYQVMRAYSPPKTE